MSMSSAGPVSHAAPIICKEATVVQYKFQVLKVPILLHTWQLIALHLGGTEVCYIEHAVRPGDQRLWSNWLIFDESMVEKITSEVF